MLPYQAPQPDVTAIITRTSGLRNISNVKMPIFWLLYNKFLVLVYAIFLVSRLCESAIELNHLCKTHSLF